MNVIQVLRFQVIRFEIVVSDGPSRRYATVMSQFSKIFLPQPEQSRSIKLGISTDVVIRVRVKWPTGFILPSLFCLIFPLDIDSRWVPVVLLTLDIISSFEQQNSLA